MQQSTRPIIIEIVVLVVALALGLFWIHASGTPSAPPDTVAMAPGAAGHPPPPPPPSNASPSDKLMLALGNLKGAVYDPVRGTLVVVSPAASTQPPVTAHDWAIALRCAASGSGPAFSLDPADKTNPRGPTLSCVYYGPISGTRLGQVMFDADWVMKQMGLGNVRPAVEGFRDLFQLSFAQDFKGASRASFMRFWITCDGLMARAAEHALVFDGIKFRVKTEKMYESSTGLVSSGGEEDPVASQFAGFLTDHFDEIAATQPSFAELKHLAGVLALANWVQDQGGQVDQLWLGTHAAEGQPTPITKESASLVREQKQENTRHVANGTETETVTHSVTLFGGVDLKLPMPKVTSDKEAQRLYKFVTTKAEWNGERLPHKSDATAVSAPMIGPQYTKRAELPRRPAACPAG